jgi:hypothetical protein
MRRSKLVLWLPAFLVVMFTASFATSEGFTLISKGQLRGELGKPDVTVVDVRTSRDWDSSEWEIKGARRGAPAEAAQWMSEYPKDRTTVLYCA